MSADGVAEKAAIKARLAVLCGGRIYREVPDEAQLATDTDTGLVRPYIILSFGSLSSVQTDRSIEGADQQPLLMPVIVECWGATGDMAEATAGAVRTLLLGWTPGADGNASEIELGGGGWFQKRDSAGRPVRYAESVTGTTTINNSILVA